MKQSLHYFNYKLFNVDDLSQLIYNFQIVKLQSPKLYDIMLDYYLSMTPEEQDLTSIDQRDAVNFIHSFYYCKPSIESDDFLRITKNYILTRLDHFNKLQLTKMLDVFKYNSKFSQQNQNLKLLMEKELEQKANQLLGDSEEEEFKQFNGDTNKNQQKNEPTKGQEQ